MVLAVLCQCGGGEPQGIYGEVHVHGFTGGSHPGALFLGLATPAERVTGDSILAEAPPQATVDSCTLTTKSCARCAPPLPVDGGPVHIAGGLRIAEVTLAFSERGYLPATPIEGAIFAGGERLDIHGEGATAPGFSGQLTAPMPLLLLQPAAPGLPDGDFVIAWPPAQATRVAVSLVVSRSDGAFAIIECVARDQAGKAIVPASLIQALPARPRDVQLIASRDELALGRSSSTRPGLRVLMHAGFETRLMWHEEP